MPRRIYQGGSTCNCFLRQRAPARSVRTNRIDLLHPQSRQLIRSWFERAWDRRNETGEEAFEPFIFAWFSVNAWSACTTETYSDRKYMEMLIADHQLATKFEELKRSDPDFLADAHRFYECWPIFSVRHLRRDNIQLHQDGIREEVVNSYLSQGAKVFEPQCWKQHRDAYEDVPCDWPHTIAAIYRVRCNLFHGEKSAYSQIDQQVVERAFRVLLGFIRGGDYL